MASQIYENVGEKICFLYFIVSSLQDSYMINSHAWYLVQLLKCFGASWFIFWAEKFIFLPGIRNTILLIIYCFQFSWSLHSVKTDIHCPVQCTWKHVLLDTNWQSTLRCNVEVSYCVWTTKFEHIKEFKKLYLFWGAEKEESIVSCGPRTGSKFHNSFLLFEEEIYKVGTERECLCIYVCACFGLKWIQIQQCISSLSFEVILEK